MSNLHQNQFSLDQNMNLVRCFWLKDFRIRDCYSPVSNAVTLPVVTKRKRRDSHSDRGIRAGRASAPAKRSMCL